MNDKTKAVRPRLGRGLSSLISASTIADSAYVPDSSPSPQSLGVPAAAAATTGQPRHIAISAISPNPYQPRRSFDPQELQELADSIRQQGILQPLIVAPVDENTPDQFVLIAGERRLRAASQAGLTTVPCVIRVATGQQMLEWALIENIQRSDLNPVDRATAYRDFMDRFQLTQEQVAHRLGQPRSTVTNYLRMLDLCDEVQAMLVSGSLSFGHAKVLAALAGQPQRQLALAKKACQEQLSVRELEVAVTQSLTADTAGDTAAKTVVAKPAYIRDLEEQLTTAVGTKVSILSGRAKHTGRIVVHFYSLDDFDRISASLGLQAQN